jgi:S1-C subfamily serine protease
MSTEATPSTQPNLPPRIESPPVASPPPIAPPPKKKRRGVAIAVVALSIVVLILLWKRGCGGGSTGDGNFQAAPKGFKWEQLAAATQTLYGQWIEEDVVVDDEEGWSGTTAVVNKRDGRLVLISNSHCLGLGSLANADSSKRNAPEVKGYGLMVVFPRGQKCPVLRIAETPRRLDLALLEIDASGLQEGVDYIVISVGHEQYKIGDDVVAVGSPHELAGTHTFGRISAIRNVQGVQLIQHHADINPGNSGGPLFLKIGADRYVWIGVNTSVAGGGLGFAIDANEALRSQYEWFPADKNGAAEAIRKMYGQPNTEVR